MGNFNQHNLKISRWIGGSFILISIALSLWKASHLQIDFSRWETLALTEAFRLELMPFTYFMMLLFVGVSLIWKHKLSLITLFVYVGFTTEELLLGYMSENAVPFSWVSQFWLAVTVFLSIKAAFLLRTGQEAHLKKYSFKNLWIGVAFGVGTGVLFSFINFF